MTWVLGPIETSKWDQTQDPARYIKASGLLASHSSCYLYFATNQNAHKAHSILNIFGVGRNADKLEEVLRAYYFGQWSV